MSNLANMRKPVHTDYKNQELINLIPFWVIQDKEVKKVDLYTADLFWIEDSGYAGFQFIVDDNNQGGNGLIVYKTHSQAKTAWQKAIKSHYDTEYQELKDEVEFYDNFRDENPEVFI